MLDEAAALVFVLCLVITLAWVVIRPRLNDLLTQPARLSSLGLRRGFSVAAFKP